MSRSSAWITLGNVVEKIVGGGTPPRTNPNFWNGDIPWASVKDFRDGLLSLDATQETITSEGLKASASNLIGPGIPIVCTRMAVGRVATSNVPVAINQDLKALYPSTEITASYLLRAIDHAKHEMERLSIGSTVKGISVRDLIRLKIFAPNAADQRHITKILDTLDNAIQKTDQFIAKLKQIKQGLLHDLLTRGIDENGQLRDPVAHPEQFKDSVLGKVPREWRVEKLGDALFMQAGNALTSEQITEVGLYPVYGGNGIRGFTTTFTHEGEFALIGRQGALCGNVLVAIGQFYATEHAVVVTPKGPTNVGWLARYLVEMNLNQYSESSAQPGLSVQKISRLPIGIPDFDEQKRIDSILKGVEEQIANEVDLVSKYTSLKKGLMHDLLIGKVRVTPTGG